MKKAESKEDILTYFWDFVHWEGLSLISENLGNYIEGKELELNIKIAFISFSDILRFRDALLVQEAEKLLWQLENAKRIKS